MSINFNSIMYLMNGVNKSNLEAAAPRKLEMTIEADYIVRFRIIEDGKTIEEFVMDDHSDTSINDRMFWLIQSELLKGTKGYAK